MTFTQSEIALMRETGCKYPRFEFLPEWWEFAKQIKDDEQMVNYFRCITHYALSEREPQPGEMLGNTLKYFNNTIRPNLDQQHTAMRAALQKYGYGE